ncbi:MAG: amidohydrolase family protein [Proteobacteria bacterium]|nr:amidohydrolase family protein [Pseudomonadota bacterium]
MDLIIRGANLPDGRSGVDIGVEKGKIVAVEPSLEAAAPHEIDATGRLVTPPFVEAHLHLDVVFSLEAGRINQSGTLLEAIAIWSKMKPELTAEAIAERALRYCDWAVARGVLAIRSHVDVCDPNLLGVDALLDVKQRVKPYLDLQLVAFPQDGYYRYPGAVDLLETALDRGVDVVGGIPHFERTMKEGGASVRALCEIAAKRGLCVDLHCDETDDPLSRHIETLAAETLRVGLQGRATGSHLTSMHSMDNYYVSKLIPLIAEAQIGVVANPLANVVVQGRHDNYPKRRGLTRVPELMAAGVAVAFGHDVMLDPFYALGSADMLEVAQMGLHLAHMTGQEAMRQCFAAVTENPAAILGLEGYGIAPGCYADIVVLQAADPVEAIRLRATRLYVIRRGKVIAESAPTTVNLSLDNRPKTIDFSWHS